MNVQPEAIREKALELGYEKCAVLPLANLDGFGSEVDRRLDKIPDDNRKAIDKAVLDRFKAFDRLAELYPWARAAVICVMGYGVYRIPDNLKNRVARYFCVDSRKDERSGEFKASQAFEDYLTSLGLKIQTERQYGLLPLRWAAYKAGLGVGRRNNFFYTGRGSWIHLESWLIDRDLELTETSDLKPCPEECQKCQKACPTGALAEPYLTRPGSCLTLINALRPVNWIDHPYSQAAGDWIYGCELCQTCCPYNQGKWQEEKDFPGLEELSRHLDLGQIIGADYSFIRENLVPKFWYLTADRDWQWKVNALNAMKNRWKPEYGPYLERALNDERPEVRQMAEWAGRLLKRRSGL
ncbi:MAG: epoxyqueuosine reductase [Deltaproteobacteria bacterium]|jgi:epoxyqueuosine reductase|nr:epoxyqueuosine reductase [Deltaproteobacteria bacterium]